MKWDAWPMVCLAAAAGCLIALDSIHPHLEKGFAIFMFLPNSPLITSFLASKTLMNCLLFHQLSPRSSPNRRWLARPDFTGQAGLAVGSLSTKFSDGYYRLIDVNSIDVAQNSIDDEIKRLENYKKFILSGTTFAADHPFTNMSSSSNVGKPLDCRLISVF